MLDIGDVMDGLGVRLDTITGLRVYPFPADQVSPPAAVVAFPEPLEFDVTMGPGVDRATFPVHVLVGRVSDRASRDALAAYMAVSGAKSVKAAIEGDITLGGAADSTSVDSVTVAFMNVAGIDLLAASFQIEVVG